MVTIKRVGIEHIAILERKLWEVRRRYQIRSLKSVQKTLFYRFKIFLLYKNILHKRNANHAVKSGNAAAFLVSY